MYCWNCEKELKDTEGTTTEKYLGSSICDCGTWNDIPRCHTNPNGSKDAIRFLDVADRFLRRKATIGELRAAVRAAKGSSWKGYEIVVEKFASYKEAIHRFSILYDDDREPDLLTLDNNQGYEVHWRKE